MEKLVPRLRFPGFIGKWREVPLKEVTTINPSNVTLPESFIYIDLESVNNGILTKTETIEKINAPSRAQRFLQKNDILFQTVRPYQMNNFYFDRTGEYVASTGYAQIRTLESSKFIFQYLHFKDFVDKVIEKCTGSNYPAINSTDLGKIKIAIPTILEQDKIAHLLSVVDFNIDSLKKKKTLLEKYKKGMMQKIFNHEIRFKDEDGKDFGEWTSLTMGEITIKTDKKNKDVIKYPIYSINNVNGFVPQSEQFEGVDSNDRGYDISLYKIIDSNTFAYNPARIDVGSIGYSGNFGTVIISSLYVCFKTIERVNDEYLYQIFKTSSFRSSVVKFLEGGVRNYLFYDSFSKISINLPTTEEQVKIASLLSAIDDKINLVAKEIEKMEVWKKGLLGEMFV